MFVSFYYYSLLTCISFEKGSDKPVLAVCCKKYCAHYCVKGPHSSVSNDHSYTLYLLFMGGYRIRYIYTIHQKTVGFFVFDVHPCLLLPSVPIGSHGDSTTDSPRSSERFQGQRIWVDWSIVFPHAIFQAGIFVTGTRACCLHTQV